MPRIRRVNAATRSTSSASRRAYFIFGSVCLIRADAGPRVLLQPRQAAAGTLSTVYWLALLSVPSSDQSIGTETGAPGRARVE